MLYNMLENRNSTRLQSLLLHSPQQSDHLMKLVNGSSCRVFASLFGDGSFGAF